MSVSQEVGGRVEASWQRRRDRLALAGLTAEQRMSPERARAILAERARLLAQVPPQPRAGIEILDVLVFALGTERYAIEMSQLREVMKLREFTPLPGTPDFLLGVTNLRGQILALFDLHRLFGLPGQPATENSRILVLGGERTEFGVLADAVFEVMRLGSDQVLPAPDSVGGVAREYVRGVTADALVLLDGAVLINDSRLIIDQGA